MTRFENYLISEGYTRKPTHRSAKYCEYSSMGNIATRYEKNGNVILYGLFEKGYPPMIIGPRPLAFNGNDFAYEMSSAQMLEFEIGNDPATVLDACLNRKIIRYDLH